MPSFFPFLFGFIAARSAIDCFVLLNNHFFFLVPVLRPPEGMPTALVYVYYDASDPDDSASNAASVAEFLLPAPDDGSKWDSLGATKSSIEGMGVVPRGPRWSVLNRTRLLPYLGLETVVEDEQTAQCFVKVLQGKFEQLNVAALQAAIGGAWMRDGPGYCVPLIADRKALPSHTELLQVTYGVC